ncbi:MAG: hypothetical protein JWO25_3009 [Alphaproteobacteria bacterium]|nr:hypothetical protein [Alphaproteobacteria bacterium]MDB5722599.1 hypothetical protein [Alphaproteobacteria bacterium]
MAKIGKILMPIAALVCGIAAGGGTAYATAKFFHHGPPAAPTNVPTLFVPTGAILAPLVFQDGRLSGYVSFQVQLEVPIDQGPAITERIPVLLDAINMRTYRTPMASGPDGMLPNLDAFRKVVDEASTQAFGKGVVKKAVVTQASPA